MQSAKLDRNIRSGGDNVQIDIRKTPCQQQIGGAGIQEHRTSLSDQLQGFLRHSQLAGVIFLQAHIVARITGVMHRPGTATDLNDNAALLQRIQIPMNGHHRHIRTQHLELTDGHHMIFFNFLSDFFLSDGIHNVHPMLYSQIS